MQIMKKLCEWMLWGLGYVVLWVMVGLMAVAVMAMGKYIWGLVQ